MTPPTARVAAPRRSLGQADAQRVRASLSPQLERKAARSSRRPASRRRASARRTRARSSGASRGRAPPGGPSANRSSAGRAPRGGSAASGRRGSLRVAGALSVRLSSFSVVLLAPAGHQLVGQPELVEHAPDHGVQQRIQRRRLRIKRRRGRQDDRARARHRQHVLEVDRRQRRLAHDQHQLAPLLHHHVRGAPDQIVGDAVGDARQAAGRAGDDHHRVPARRARGERRAEVAQAVRLKG